MGLYETMAGIPGLTLRGYYKCDEAAGTVADDLHTSGIDAQIVGTLGRNATGLSPASTRSFGGGGGLKIPGRLVWGDGFTIAMLVRFDDITAVRQGVWFNGGGTGGAGQILNGNGQNDGKMWWLEQGVAWGAQTWVPVTAQVYTYIFSWTGDISLARHFIDGTEVLAQFKAVPSDLGTDFLMIGCEGEEGGNPIVGAFDEVFVYTGNLEPTDVAAMHGALLSPAPDPDADPLEPLYSGLRYRHSTGALPYTVREGAAPNGDEHYDTPNDMQNARDIMVHFGAEPTDWSESESRAIIMWRDKWVIPSGGGVAGYHRHSHGIARHALETGDTLSINAAYMISPNASRDNNGLYAHPDTVAFWEGRMAYPYNTRELAFELMSMVDASRAGHPKHGMTERWVQAGIDIIDHNVAPVEERFGSFTWGFIISLYARAMINYWFFYRDAQWAGEAPIQAARDSIPPALDRLCAHTEANLWWPEGVSVPVAFSGDTWSHGALKYVYPPGDTPSHLPKGPFTVTAVDDWKNFYGDPSCSTVDDYYKFNYVGSPRITGGHFWVKQYIGATRKFVMERTFVPNGDVLLVGDSFNVIPEGSTLAGGGWAPDAAFPMANSMMMGIFSFMAWYYTHVAPDPVKAAARLEFYDKMFKGQSLMWGNPWMQKEWNECVYNLAPAMGWAIAAREDTDTTFDSLAVETEPLPVSTYTLSGPATGEVDEPSGNFTVTLAAGTVAGTIRFTPASSAGAGTFNPAFLDLTQVARSGTFTYTPTTAGARTITAPDNGGLTDPAGVSYTATAPDEVPDAPTTFTLTGPTEGVEDVQSTDFTVTLGPGVLPGTARFTPHVVGGTGTFNPAFLDLTDGIRGGTFRYTPNEAGVHTISVTDNAGLADPNPVAYAVSVPPAEVADFTLTGPNSGEANSPSTAFTITLGAGLLTGTARFTPQASSGTGLFIPTFVDLDNVVRSGTFLFIPFTTGFRTITAPDNRGLADPSGVGFTATEPSTPPPAPPDDTPRPGNSIRVGGSSSGATTLIIRI